MKIPTRNQFLNLKIICISTNSVRKSMILDHKQGQSRRYKQHKMVGNIFSYRHQHNTRAAIRIEMPPSMALPTSVGCPFGATGPGAIVPPPVVVVGALTGGRGGSITLSSERMGSGASAGGKLCGSMIERRPPVGTGSVYIGLSLYAKHRFPVCQKKRGD